jgi:anti-anti-sigma factor
MPSFDSASSIAALRPGDHCYVPFGGDAEHSDLLTAYIWEGLHRREQVLYVGPPFRTEKIRAEFGEHGLRVADAQATYLHAGRFAPERTVPFYTAAVEDALSSGYTGVRIAADMDWAEVLNDRDIGRLVDYEREIAAAFGGLPATIVCQYDTRTFGKAVLDQLASAHTCTAMPAPLHTGSFLRIARHYDPPGLVVEGEIDLSNNGSFKEALQALLQSEERVLRIDASGVRFMDAHTIGMLIGAARDLTGDRRMHVRLNQQIHRLVQLSGADGAYALVFEETL